MNVPIVDDLIHESNETVNITLGTTQINSPESDRIGADAA